MINAPVDRARLTSFSVMPPTPCKTTFTRTSSCLIFCSSETAASTEPTTSPLRIRFRSCTPPRPSCSKTSSRETEDALRCANCSRRSRSPRVCATSRARRSFSTTRAVSPAGGGLSKPRISTGVPGVASRSFSPREIVQRPDSRPGIAGDDRVAHLQRAALDEHRGDRPTPLVEARLDDRARCIRARVGLQLLELDIGDEQHLLEQLVEADAGPRGHLGDLRRPAPFLR